jgi:hypothetical protein
MEAERDGKEPEETEEAEEEERQEGDQAEEDRRVGINEEISTPC